MKLAGCSCILSISSIKWKCTERGEINGNKLTNAEFYNIWYTEVRTCQYISKMKKKKEKSMGSCRISLSFCFLQQVKIISLSSITTQVQKPPEKTPFYKWLRNGGIFSSKHQALKGIKGIPILYTKHIVRYKVKLLRLLNSSTALMPISTRVIILIN